MRDAGGGEACWIRVYFSEMKVCILHCAFCPPYSLSRAEMSWSRTSSILLLLYLLLPNFATYLEEGNSRRRGR